MFSLLGLMPFILGTAASYSYDNFNNIAIFIFIAYILHLAFVKTDVGKRDLAILIVLFALFAPLKLIYAPLLFLIFLIPKQKFSGSRIRILTLIVSAVAACLSTNFFDNFPKPSDSALSL